MSRRVWVFRSPWATQLMQRPEAPASTPDPDPFWDQTYGDGTRMMPPGVVGHEGESRG